MNIQKDFFVKFATNKYTLMQSKQILEDLFKIELVLNDSSFEDGMLYKYRFPNSYGRISLSENYMPDVDEWKSPKLKQYNVIINFLGLELNVEELNMLKQYFEYLYSKQI